MTKKDVYYFRHDANANADLKMKGLRRKFGWQGYGWFWYLIELLRNEPGYKLDYNENTFAALADDFKCEPSDVQQFIDHCIQTTKLLEAHNGHFFSNRLVRDMLYVQEIREKAALAGMQSGRKRRGKKQQTLNERSTDVPSPTETPKTEAPKRKNDRTLNERSTDAELLKEIKEEDTKVDDNTLYDNSTTKTVNLSKKEKYIRASAIPVFNKLPKELIKELEEENADKIGVLTQAYKEYFKFLGVAAAARSAIAGIAREFNYSWVAILGAFYCCSVELVDPCRLPLKDIISYTYKKLEKWQTI